MNAQADSIKDQVDIIQRHWQMIGRVGSILVAQLSILKEYRNSGWGECSRPDHVIPQNPNDTFTYTLYHDAMAWLMQLIHSLMTYLRLRSAASFNSTSLKSPGTNNGGMSSVANIVVKANNTIQAWMIYKTLTWPR